MSSVPGVKPDWPAISLAEAHARLTAPGSPFEVAEAAIRGQRLRVWKNAPPTLREVFLLGRSFGPRDFLVYDDDRATYEGFSRAVLALAAHLRALGVGKGDRVAIAMRNLPEWPVAFFAAALSGAVATPLNAWWTGPELEYGLRDSGATVAIVDSERFERLSEHLHACPDLTRLLVCRHDEDMGHPLAARLEDVIGQPNDWASLPPGLMPEVSLEAEDNATIFYTSGTTGHPKGALGTHRNAAMNIMNGVFSLARTYLRRGEPLPTPDPNARQKATLLSIPFFHTTGCNAVLIPAMGQGAKIVLMHRFEPVQAMRLIEREKCTTCGGVPAIAWAIVEHPERDKYDLSSLEAVAYGGAPAAADLVKRIGEEIPKSLPAIGWGMTETSSTFTHHAGEDYTFRPESSGPALPVCDMKIVGDKGETLPPGETGELWARGPNIVKAYWGKPEATAETFIDGWVKTGDLAKLDEEGFLYILDRKKDMLIRGGENIYCIEVENALFDHPDIVDAAVVGIPHKVLGEEPGAVVTLKPGAQTSEQDIRAFVAERLAAFKVPVRVVARDEMLPRNPNGKILKNVLKPLFQDQN
jgi:long-chain acyl-CoA synthetase